MLFTLVVLCALVHVGDPSTGPVPPQQPFDNDFRTSLSYPIVKIDGDISRNVLIESVGNFKMLKGSIATRLYPAGPGIGKTSKLSQASQARACIIICRTKNDVSHYGSSAKELPSANGNQLYEIFI